MEGSNNDGDYVIMDNDKLVGKNCLTFIHNTELSNVLIKFIDSMVYFILTEMRNTIEQQNLR